MSILMTAVELAYSAGTLAAWCAGAFGIGATQSDVKRQAEAVKAERLAEVKRRGLTGYPSLTQAAGLAPTASESYRFLVARSWSRTLAAGVVWPVAVPVYICYRKGCYVGSSVARRDELDQHADRLSAMADDLERRIREQEQRFARRIAS